MPELHLLVDGVAFQQGDAGACATWNLLLPDLARDPALRVSVLDRGRMPRIAGLHGLPFPDYRDVQAAADSQLLQDFCDHFQIDVFTSTGCTTPLHTPTLLLMHEGAAPRAGVEGVEPADRAAMERHTAIAFAQRYVCLSAAGAAALLHACPELPPQQVDVVDATPDGLTAAFTRGLDQLLREARSGTYRHFFDQWSALRGMQARVDLSR